ncbi:ubiquinone biosynthesis protein UbiA [Rhodonellum psychrophilum GCM71 = DSM 17998]|uniref:Ubiquinone biosynthesis protein UbiA n=2 Tax=Rhodonellum TaxID=336827 RepID=U5BNJ6_9BACT|nr:MULTISPECIES: UbiA family prenyltransferase [Rhodonellum]ERM82120.1 ubiquinone biosynthesis protein UbiA [Rhodonellum psychrophilum GCM71 = DSM 17998]SDY64138.1 1,4-dihydroxy-2-naphthoate octaprenyltransferase [Rhodonellum ikkaensis]
MLKLSSWKHLRIPFSFYLLPVFIFALAFTPNHNPERLLIVFVALHLFLYPSSNGYNSYFDKDEKSIGGLKNPPKVTKGLYYLSLLFFVVSLFLGSLINWAFVSMLLVYSLVSMAYSHPSIRLKKYAYLSWITAGIFQGFFTFVMCYAGLSDFGWEVFSKPHVVIPGLLTSIMLLGSYPLTQVYQHEEDSKRGDQTLSLKLGIKGTFLFSSVWFLVAGIAFGTFFFSRNQEWAFYGFLLAMLPVILYFLVWFRFIQKDQKEYANYTWAMWMNRISALALNVFFAWYFLENTQILQVF